MLSCSVMSSMLVNLSAAAGSFLAITLFFWLVNFRSLSLRWFIFEILGRLKGVPVVWIECPLAAARVMKGSSDKGVFLERTFSTPAWLPLLSIESVDGPQWRSMKANLVTFMQSLPPMAALQSITQRVTLESMATLDCVNADAIASISVAAFFEWIFQFKMPTALRDLVTAASWEWRKEIALKGVGDMALKRKAVDAIVLEILAAPHVCNVFGAAQWLQPEFHSLLLQPFLISPAINVADVAVQVHRLTTVDPTHYPDTMQQATNLIHLAIDTAHPFVLFERYLPEGLQDDVVNIAPRTHVFMPVDVMKTDAIIRFGAGARKCPGAHLGMACMLGLFTKDVLGHAKFQPHVGHLYSGRDQDGQETMYETLYQGRQALHAMRDALQDRLAKLRWTK
ncbi:hypothetical protein DYB32_006446 [Aphanomyces invadans]|nr:hypothetical protein DYB32_006446 [Aphanomyces invadans]